ncbi:hypothetical protein [Bosea sp. TND4EK4]|uniref:hypothetical protein n=1 Tax=Bosea sp. TND4EK4 TaxID=1907408 RepID=UPI0009562842|nr:hypothetical protein [Bosea sp. TND4EK4]SIP95700.1 hypothetical protein SAMN05880592_101324 [Bosea sp. TND4EK4]
MSGLPPATEDVARFVDLVGADATLKLLEARGGTRLWIPERSEDSTLAEIVGLDAAVQLYRKYGAGEIKVPLGRQWRVLCYIAMGLNRSQTALRAGCTENTVHDILQRLGRPQAAQLDLFP